MVKKPSTPKPPKRSAADYLPEKETLAAMKTAVQHCRGCDLFKNATQAVFGEGPKKARIMLVGEQPGDQEDRAGHPFIGPAGHLLDEALEAAGIDRSEVYVTNAVKHFKWEPRGKTRLHAKPNTGEIKACLPWLAEEIKIVQPEIIIAMGATAAQAVYGKLMPVLANRRKWLASPWSEKTTITVHPSSILRAPSHEDREKGLHDFISDLKFAKKPKS